MDNKNRFLNDFLSQRTRSKWKMRIELTLSKTANRTDKPQDSPLVPCFILSMFGARYFGSVYMVPHGHDTMFEQFAVILFLLLFLLLVVIKFCNVIINSVKTTLVFELSNLIS